MRILVVDDDSMDRQLMVEMLSALCEGAQITVADGGQEACRLLERDPYDAVFTDLRMPGCDGLAVLHSARRGPSGAEVVIVTGYGDVPSAVQALKEGCFDYLLKPVSVEQVEACLERLTKHVRLRRENEYLRQELFHAEDGPIVGRSPALLEVCRKAVQVAATDATVLIQGESGTGKELVSQLIHLSSPRAKGPFVRVNCAALSESILESELFGHEKGAFTGAHASRAGRFELAHGGTLLLDEISETSGKLQAELLRVIETKQFERVGGTRTIRVDVRIIATTNRDLKQQVRRGQFREDLFYRLNVVPLTLPPLRERDGDVDLLTQHFLERFSRRLGKPVPEVAPEVMDALRRYPWPGNVRELQNLIQRLLIMDADGRIGPEDLPAGLRDGPVADEGPPPGASLDEIERYYILKTLREVGGNRTLAAQRLRISTRTIRNKLKRYREEGLLTEQWGQFGGQRAA